ncbi:MAG: ribonuclease HII [Lachnospiraceae bacterium]|nr:ribonuclease HII [Lachnospiraceae bacterium]
MAESISNIKTEFNNLKEGEYSAFIEKYSSDERSGVIQLVERAGKAIEKHNAEIKRTEQMLSFERQYGCYSSICGIDEAGRGPLAGPVVAGAVILPKDETILYLNDSKQLSAAKRDEMFDVINERAVAVGVGIVDHKRIDEINILQATYEAMRMAIMNLKIKPDILLNDAVTIPGIDIKQVPIIKGDAKSCSIAAASIIAKVTRDRIMIEMDKKYPGYNFANNKGYGSDKKHIEGLKKLGPCPIHRVSFIGNFI